jgi:hypothetical protein
MVHCQPRAAEAKAIGEAQPLNDVEPIWTTQAEEAKAIGEAQPLNVVEPIWTTLRPVSKRVQYLLHWFIAETLPPELEASMGPPPESREYQEPPPYPTDLRLFDRIAAEPDGYEPKRYENTGVDSDEANYTSFLLPIKVAMTRLGSNSMAEVVALGWERIQARLAAEMPEREWDAIWEDVSQA